MNGFTETEIRAILQTNGLNEAQIEQALVFAQSQKSIKLYNAEVVKATLQNTNLSSTEEKRILDKLKLIGYTTGEIIATKQVSLEKIKEAVANIGLEESEAQVTTERIFAILTQKQEKASLESLILLTKKQIAENAKYIASMVAAHPVATALITALTAIGVAIAYNIHQEKEHQEAIKKSISAMSEATSAYSQSASTLDSLTEKYKSLRKQLSDTNLTEKETYQVRFV